MQATIEHSPYQEDDMEEHRRTRNAKRKRLVRKGTHSCWACKHRKEKCCPDPAGGDICHGCQRRGTKCVSQEFPDETPANTRQQYHAAQIDARMQRIETAVEQLVSSLQTKSPESIPFPHPRSVADIEPSNLTTAHADHLRLPTPISLTESDHRPWRPSEGEDTNPLSSRPSSATLSASLEPASLWDLSELLHRSLPCRRDTQLIRMVNLRQPNLSAFHITRSYATLQRCGLKAADGVLPEPPRRTTHPILTARYMLHLAIYLQYTNHEAHPEFKQLSESPSRIMERAANTAMALIRTRDELLGSIESLECVVLEGVYRCNSGQLRLSWMACRRAMLLAQVMGLHLVEQGDGHTCRVLDAAATHVEPGLLWFRIVSFDLLMCRMLGLPPGIADACPSSFEATPDTALGLLERKHTEVMARFLQRKASESRLPDFEKTLSLDQELQKAAKAMPSEWWLVPHLIESADDPVATFWNMKRLQAQTIHFDLLNQLYLPYMLEQRQSARDIQRFGIARMVCVNSSREVLSRLLLLRRHDQTATTCRIFDFTGLMAAITLVLAHLDGQQGLLDNISPQAGSLVSHQVPSDRAMMEQVLKTMQQVSRLSGDALSARSAEVLQRLLDIEIKRDHDTAEEHVSVHKNLASANQDSQRPRWDGEKPERVVVPYFGFIEIIREKTTLRPTSAWTKMFGGDGQSMINTLTGAPGPHGLSLVHGQNNGIGVQNPSQSFDALLHDEFSGLQDMNISFLDDFFDGTSGNETGHDVLREETEPRANV